jgi:RNA recognition motif-containing protein
LAPSTSHFLRGFAYITFVSQAAADKAIAYWDGRFFMKHTLRVRLM